MFIRNVLYAGQRHCNAPYSTRVLNAARVTAYSSSCAICGENRRIKHNLVLNAACAICGVTLRALMTAGTENVLAVFPDEEINRKHQSCYIQGTSRNVFQMKAQNRSLRTYPIGSSLQYFVK